MVAGEQAALGEGRIQEGLTGEAAFEMELKYGKDFAGRKRVDERRRRLEMSSLHFRRVFTSPSQPPKHKIGRAHV